MEGIHCKECGRRRQAAVNGSSRCMKSLLGALTSALVWVLYGSSQVFLGRHPCPSLFLAVFFYMYYHASLPGLKTKLNGQETIPQLSAVVFCVCLDFGYLKQCYTPPILFLSLKVC